MKSYTLPIILGLFVFSLNASSRPTKYKNTRDYSIVFFCDEPAPMYKAHVSKRYNETLEESQNSSLIHIKNRAKSYFKIIEPILKKYKIPNDFKYVSIVESNLVATARNRSGAYGYWQFMPETAVEMGLVISKNRDDRSNLVKSTHAACKYFSKLYEELGSWTLVAAAYNAGPNKMNQYMNRAESMSYYDLNMKPETAKYIYKILAFKQLFEPIQVASEKKSMRIVSDRPTDKVSQYGLVRIKSPVYMPDPEPTVRVVVKSKTITVPSVLIDGNSTQKGQYWIFKVNHNISIANQNYEAGDKIYAVVESFDETSSKIYLRANKLYSPRKHEIYDVSLALIEDDKLGIMLPISRNKAVSWKKI